MFLSLRSGLSVISRGVIAGAQQSYNRILKLFPTVSSQAPASARPVQQGQVCEFDGVNDYINCGNSTSFDFTDLINIQFYLKLNGTGLQNFISKGVGATTNYAVDYSNGLRFFGYESGSPAGSLSGYTLSTGQWYHIQCIKDATHFRIFVDGIEVRTVASTATLTTNSVSFLIGKRSTLHCDGYMSGVIISDVAQYNLNHASGTTAYDSSGNGNDGTLQNGAAFVVDNTLPPEADKLNLEGYTDDSGVLKPRDESDPTKDIDGNPLQYSGSVYPRRPEYRNSYAASFDGVNDYVDTGITTSSDTYIEATIKKSSVVNTRFIFGCNNSAGTERIYVDDRTGLFRFVIGSNSDRIEVSATTGVWYVLRLYTNGDVYIDGALAGNTGGTMDATETIFLGARNNGGNDATWWSGTMSTAKIYSNGALAQYNFTEGAGDTAYDVSGNGNHGTINNASTGTEGAGFWAGRIDGEANALNNNNGFSKRMLFDGVDDFVDVFDNETVPAVYQSLSDDITIEANIWRASSGGSDAHVWRVAETVAELRQIGTSAGLGIPFSFGVDGDKIALGVTDDYTTGSENRQANTTLSRFTPYHIKVVISGDNYEFFLDGVSDGSGTFTTATGDRSVGANSSTLTFGSRSKDSGVRDSNMVDGVIWGAKISTDSGATVIGSWNGYGNTDADWTDQIGSNNGTVNGSPALLRIPADTSEPTKDVFGDTLTNPAITDGYNDSETELDAYNIAEGDNPSPATNNNSDLDAIEFGEDLSSNDAAFMRLTSSTQNDRLITFEDDLTGEDKELVEKFTETP